MTHATLRRATVWIAAIVLLSSAWPRPASAFCGFYVSGAEGSLYASATMVVLMRSGTRTVLSMQNDYQGPPESFAMVVPVPTVLSASDVHTLPRAVFDRVDALSAPRLVEYWEEDPCADRDYGLSRGVRRRSGGMGGSGTSASSAGELRVTVEAEFAVGEYDIAILSASDSSDLETWLHQEHYNIPVGASEVLRPYVESGTKFFVARVDASRVTFAGGRAVLSPLRIAYDTPDFTLPVRLGLLNSNGSQDLIVHILAPSRYEVANYTNRFIPTNLRVRNGVRDNFGRFYETVFRETVARDPHTVVTEYAWTATTCDPCPTTPLSASELAVLGADVMPDVAPPSGRRSRGTPWTLTRLHYRYDAGSLGEDLVFREAAAVVGGRDVPSASGHIDQSVTEGGTTNAFQGRYVILHWWNRPITCDAPHRGEWGGPPGGGRPASSSAPRVMTEGVPTPLRSLGRWVRDDIDALDIEAIAPVTSSPSPSPSPSPSSRTEAGGPHARAPSHLSGNRYATLSLFALPMVGLLVSRRRKR